MGVSINLYKNKHYNAINTWISSYEAFPVFPPTSQTSTNSLTVYDVKSNN